MVATEYETRRSTYRDLPVRERGTSMISVIIPIHNEEEMLSKYSTRLYPAIDYYKRQFSEEVEVVLVDDGSTDASWGMVKFLAEYRTDTIGVYHKKNR